MNKPFSQASENNKSPILKILKIAFADRRKVLEIGSGTGQHAVFFSRHLPHLTWQPSDRRENLDGIGKWREEFPSLNLQTAWELDVGQGQWPGDFDAVFSANTAHIMAWSLVQTMIKEIGQRLPSQGKFALYGPFNYDGTYTSESNQAFDQRLKGISPSQGIRDFEKVDEFANQFGLKVLQDFAMPANNRLIVWQKIKTHRSE